MKIQQSIATLFVAAFMLSSCSDKTTGKNTKENQPAAQEEAQATPLISSASNRAPDDVTISKTDTGKAEGLFFIVKNTKELSVERGLVTAPEEGEKYIAAQIWMRNTSDADIDLNREDFKLFDQNDAEFVEKTRFVEHRKAPFMFSAAPEVLTLKPNQSKSGWITFTADKESTAKKISYKNVTVTL